MVIRAEELSVESGLESAFELISVGFFAIRSKNLDQFGRLPDNVFTAGRKPDSRGIPILQPACKAGGLYNQGIGGKHPSVFGDNGRFGCLQGDGKLAITADSGVKQTAIGAFKGYCRVFIPLIIPVNDPGLYGLLHFLALLIATGQQALQPVEESSQPGRRRCAFQADNQIAFVFVEAGHCNPGVARQGSILRRGKGGQRSAGIAGLPGKYLYRIFGNGQKVVSVL